MDAIASSETALQIMMGTNAQIRDRWSTFALLDAANGPPSDEMEPLGVPQVDWKKFEIEGVPIDRCGLIPAWQ